MAKLIYEDDEGRQTTFEFTVEMAADLESLYGIDAWDEILKSFKTIIKNQTEEV